jgi:large subunit ribosomal protein L32
VGAVPKKRVSHARKGHRHQHDKLWKHLPQLTICPQCHQLHQTHHVCTNCGMYRGRQVLPVKENRPTTE